ncbi:MAG: CRISPR system precrRNA processing endoribonuclease RAMP protein Cas6 [Acetobacteraceae bacterium]
MPSEQDSGWVGPIVSVTIFFRPTGPARFARFPGSAWRGAFGHSLKRLVCVMHLRPCEGCALQQACVFPQVFEPPVPADAPILVNYRVAPTGFVLDPAETPRGSFYVPDDLVPVTFRLFGRLARFAPYVLKALLEAAEHGVGPDRASLTPGLAQSGLIADVQAARPFDAALASALLAPGVFVVPSAPAGPVEIQFSTPLRLRLRNDLVAPQHLSPAHLLGAAVRRVSLVSLFFGSDPPKFDHRALKEAAQRIEWRKSSFHWIETTRRSARQQAVMQLGGIIGDAVLDLSSAPELWPFLWLGQWLHVGKGPTMGFGRYRIAAA